MTVYFRTWYVLIVFYPRNKYIAYGFRVACGTAFICALCGVLWRELQLSEGQVENAHFLGGVRVCKAEGYIMKYVVTVRTMFFTRTVNPIRVPAPHALLHYLTRTVFRMKFSSAHFDMGGVNEKSCRWNFWNINAPFAAYFTPNSDMIEYVSFVWAINYVQGFHPSWLPPLLSYFSK